MQKLFPRHLSRDLLVLTALLLAAVAALFVAYQPRRSTLLAVDAPAVMLPATGLHDLEPLASGPGFFRWTTGDARLELPNPGGPLVVRLALASGFDRPTPAVISTSGTLFPLNIQPGLHNYTLYLAAQPAERTAITITSPTVNLDGRELGVQLQQLTIAGSGGVPWLALVGLLLATAGGYSLLRRAGLAWWASAGLILTLLFLATLWQGAYGWRYGFFGPLLLAVGAASGFAAVMDKGDRGTGGQEDNIIHGSAMELEPPAHPLTRSPAHLLTLLLLALACCLPWLAAPDPVGDMELAARRMWFMYERGLSEAHTGGGDYMPLRIYILYLLGPLVPALGSSFFEPLPPITMLLIKLPSLLANLATAVLLYLWSQRWLPARGAWAIAALHAVAPPVWINAAWWGQVDVLLSFPLLLAVALFERGRGVPSWLCWTVALLIKPQAIILAPLMYIVTLRRHGCRGLALGGGAAALLLVAAITPIALAGQGPGLYQAAAGSVGRFPDATARAYNLWWIITGGERTSDLTEGLFGLSYRSWGLLLLGGVALLVSLALWRRSDGPARAWAAATLALAFFVLPTQIHERYAFFALAFLALLIASERRAVYPYLLLACTATINILGALSGFWSQATAFIVQSPLPLAAAWLHLALLGWMLWKIMTTSTSTPR
jgi:Gpi18-like mannosyltransferase